MTPNHHLLRSILKFCRKPLSIVPNQGWTLIEIGAITVIVGILAAMSYPSMAGMQARNKLKETQNQLRSTLMDAQRTAIKNGQRCIVSFTTTNAGSANETTIIDSTVEGSSPPQPCITSGGGGDDSSSSNSSRIELRKDKSGRTFISNISGGTLAFSYKGTITLPDSGTILLKSTGTPETKCLVISSPLGIIRSGYYQGSESPLNPDNCNTSL